MWTLYNVKLGSLHTLTDDEAEAAKKFYHLFMYLGTWRNGRGDIYLWEGEEK